MRSTGVTLLNPKQVAKILNVSELSLSEWRQKGIGPDFIWLDIKRRNVKYSLDAIMDFVKDGKLSQYPPTASTNHPAK